MGELDVSSDDLLRGMRAAAGRRDWFTTAHIASELDAYLSAGGNPPGAWVGDSVIIGTAEGWATIVAAVTVPLAAWESASADERRAMLGQAMSETLGHVQ